MVALVGTVKVIASGYSASHTFTLDAAVASGNALILAFQSPGTPTSVLDSTSTPLVASATPQLTNEGNYQYFYHLTAITDGPTTVTVAFAGGTGLSGHCMEVSGLAASPVDNFDYELSGNVSSFVANYTTAAANALVVGVVDISSGLGMNVPTSGFVEAVIESWSSTFYNLDAGAAGAKSVTVNTDTANAVMSVSLMVYRAFVSGTTARPSAVTPGTWTDEAGGTLVVADINDASDSTGAKDPAGASYPVLAFTMDTPMAASVSQTCYFRGNDVAAGKQVRQVLFANDGTTVVATGAWKTMTGSLATYSDVLTPTATAYKGEIQTQAA